MKFSRKQRNVLVSFLLLFILLLLKQPQWQLEVAPDFSTVTLQVISPTLSMATKSELTPTPTLLPSVSIPASPSSPLMEKVHVQRVIDGDTIQLENGKKVRYIGIDTPETKDPRRPVQCYGQEAAAQNKALVEGKDVFLEKDVSETDSFGRWLRYVYVDDQMVNALLVQQGYAYARSYPPDVKYQSLFQQLESAAQQQQFGLWSTFCIPSPTRQPTPS